MWNISNIFCIKNWQKIDKESPKHWQEIDKNWQKLTKIDKKILEIFQISENQKLKAGQAKHRSILSAH